MTFQVIQRLINVHTHTFVAIHLNTHQSKSIQGKKPERVFEYNHRLREGSSKESFHKLPTLQGIRQEIKMGADLFLEVPVPGLTQ